MKRFVIGIAAWLACSACDDPLEPVERIEDFRVLGARVEVDGEPSRAAPAPGETASVRWLVAAPEPEPAIGWALAVCAAAPMRAGIPTCDGSPFATLVSPSPAPEAPRIDFTVPETLDDDVSRLLVVGSICEGRVPTGAPEDSACPRGVAGTKVTFTFDRFRSDDVNMNPSFAEPALTLDGDDWAPSTTTPPSCESGELPTIAAGSSGHRIDVHVAPDARDPLPHENELDPEREGLLVAHFTTDGDLERAFSAIADEDETTSISLTWGAPKSAPGSGAVVRFWFVVRDLRGGTDFTERAVCVVP